MRHLTGESYCGTISLTSFAAKVTALTCFLLLFLFTQGASGQSVDSPVLHYEFDEGSGAVAADTSGFGNDGVFTGNPTWISGVSGSALSFGGIGDWVVVPDNATLDITDEITLAAWIRPGKQGTQYVIKKARYDVTEGYEVSLSSNGKLFVRFNQVSAGNTYKLFSTSLYPTDGNTWMHVAATYDGQEIKLYIDGILENTLPVQGLVIGTNDSNLSIGAPDGGVQPYKGAVDEVRLYNYALTEAEVWALMAGSLAPDADGDGVPDDQDAFPSDPTEWLDTDGDGIGNNADTDDDGDGMPDDWETFYGLNPLNPSDGAQDSDGDGVSNLDEFLQGTNPQDDLRFPVASWSFDEGSGTTVEDASGVGNHGSFSGLPTWTLGMSGSALQFAGDGSRVIVPHDPSLDIESEITIAAWIRPGKQGTQYVVKKARSGVTDGYELSLSSSTGQVFVRFNEASSGNAHKLFSVSEYPTDGNTWIHVAATYDGQEIKLYIDGSLESSQFISGLLIGSNDNDLSIGAQDDGVAAFEGTVDQVHIYDVALSMTEIEELFQSEGGLVELTKQLLDPAPTNTSSGEKPQSKVWFFDETWWSVFPDDTGLWVWRLDGNTWTQVLLLSSTEHIQADNELVEVGGVVHVLLFRGGTTQLASIEYVPGSPGTYQFWSQRQALVDVPVDSSAKTATIALDSSGRMWVAYDTSSAVVVRYSDPVDDYSTWSQSIVVSSGINPDDIGAIVAFDGKIGVLWSDQETERFGFRFHFDADPPTVWSDDEVPASQSALNVGGGMADDHLNFVAASDGTLYAAVKTSYDTSGLPKIALLVRRLSGNWDDLYEVDTQGTRPIVVLDETTGKLIVIYTEISNGGAIAYRLSDANDISFGPRRVLIPGTNLNNASSTKQTLVGEFVVIAAMVVPGEEADDLVPLLEKPQLEGVLFSLIPTLP